MAIPKIIIKRLLIFVTTYHILWLAVLVFKPPTVRELRARSTADNLVVYNIIGKRHGLALVEHSRRTSFVKSEWDCVIFMFESDEDDGNDYTSTNTSGSKTRTSITVPDDVDDEDEHMTSLQGELECTISRPSGETRGDFLQYITPTFVSNYDYVSLVLGDIFVPDRGPRAINAKSLLEQMQTHDVQIMSPSILGDTHGFRQVARDNDADGCLMEVNMVETHVQIFTRDAWECYYKMLHFTGGKGWCYDTCLKSQCPHLRMAQDFSMRAWHMDKRMKDLPKDEIFGTNLTDWREPNLEEHDYFDQAKPNSAICDRLGCNKTISMEMKVISCPSNNNNLKNEKVGSIVHRIEKESKR